MSTKAELNKDDERHAALEKAMHVIGRAARDAARALGDATPETKSRALRAAADAIRAHRPNIISANDKDMAAGREHGLSDAMLDRLKLDDKRIEAMAKGVEEVSELPDPVGRQLARWTR